MNDKIVFIDGDGSYFIDDRHNSAEVLRLILEDAKKKTYVSIHVKTKTDYSPDVYLEMTYAMAEYSNISVNFIRTK